MNIFSSCFSVLVIDPILGILYQEENAGSFSWFKAFHGACSVTELFLLRSRGFPTAVLGRWGLAGRSLRGQAGVSGVPHRWLQGGMGWSYSREDDYSVGGLFCLDVCWKGQEGNCCGERMITYYFWEWRLRRKWQTSVKIIFLVNRNIVTRNNGLLLRFIPVLLVSSVLISGDWREKIMNMVLCYVTLLQTVVKSIW